MGRGQGEAGSSRHVPSAQPRRRRRWTDELVVAELRRLLPRTGGRLPSAAELEQMGQKALRAAMRRRSVSYWAQRLGVELHAGQDRSAYGPDEARRELFEVFRREGQWVGSNRLRELGYPRLASYVQRRGGTLAVCSALGIEAPLKGR